MDTAHLDSGLHTDLTERIVGCAIEVHRHLGPGLTESVYESAMCIELKTASLPFTRQLGVPVFYKGALLAEYRPDLVVGDSVIVEIKCVERFDAVHVAQMLTYLKITGLRVGLILNFNRAVLKDGIRRVTL